MNTLIIHTGGIGDFILICPSIQALSHDGEITLAGYTNRLALAVQSGLARRAVSLDSIDFHSLFAVPSKALITFLGEFNRIIIWMRDDDNTIKHALERISSAIVDIFPGLPPHDWSAHASEYYQQCLEIPRLPSFNLSHPGDPIHHDIMIHPGSGSSDKNWPLENFQKLASLLEKNGRTISWCIGPAETERAMKLPESNIIHSETLNELTRHLAGAEVYIGNDSGITHLAAALQIRTIAIFNVTDHEIWAPRGKHVTVAVDNAWPTVQGIQSLLG